MTGELAMEEGEDFVDRMFERVARRWPFVVASDLRRCFLTRSAVRPGQVVKKPALMAAIQVKGTEGGFVKVRYDVSLFVEFVDGIYDLCCVVV